MKKRFFFLLIGSLAALAACSHPSPIVAQSTCKLIDGQNSTHPREGVLTAQGYDCGAGQGHDSRFKYTLFNGNKKIGTVMVTYRSLPHVDGTIIDFNVSSPIKITLGSETFVKTGKGSVGNEGRVKFDFFLPDEKKVILPKRKY